VAAAQSSTPAAGPSVTPTPTPTQAPASAAAPPSPAGKKPPVVITASRKKGVGVWKFDGAKAALADVGAGWYYNWRPDNDDLPGPGGVEFVPMIRDRATATEATLRRARAEGDELLGFNEPDMRGQANMTVDAALAAWPRLEATGMRLGSPAVAFGGDTEGGWLDRFMTEARRKGYRVDFVCLHWYGTDFGDAAVGHLLRYVDAVHQRYGKPIWITEYGLMRFAGTPRYPTPDQAAAFIKASTGELEKRSFVERYAWFGLPAVGDSAAYGLYRDGDSPTEAGKAYRAAGVGARHARTRRR